jgi:hypothetical protein
MVGLGKILGCVLLTVLGLAIFTQYDGASSVSQIAGYPVISVAQKAPVGLIAIGQFQARGVIVVAQVGWGVVSVVQGGVGLLFGLGQAVGGLVVVAQVGLGLLFFLGQVGFGLQGLGQAAGINRGLAYFKEMNAEFNQLLSFRLRAPADGQSSGGR